MVRANTAAKSCYTVTLLGIESNKTHPTEHEKRAVNWEIQPGEFKTLPSVVVALEEDHLYKKRTLSTYSGLYTLIQHPVDSESDVGVQDVYLPIF